MWTDEQYLRCIPWGPDDSDIRHQTVTIGRIRKPQKCVSPMGFAHDIPPGTRARIEKALVDGVWLRAYVCLECMDRWLTELEVDEDLPAQNSAEHSKHE